MAKSDARFGYRADLGREVHDLSAPLGFTTVPGMLNPIFEDIATPGDTYYFNHDLSFMRTQPLLGPAMIDVKVHVESFFVPIEESRYFQDEDEEQKNDTNSKYGYVRVNNHLTKGNNHREQIP